MTVAEFYVYALKDPRYSPARPFYIGKGVGTRSTDHLRKPDSTARGERIRQIQEEGKSVLVSTLVENLTEAQAIRLEAELISAFGVEANGGLLTNVVIPTGLAKQSRVGLVVPAGSQERAQIGLQLLKESVLELARANDKGVTNADCASILGLRSNYGGGSKDYLSYSILGLLMQDGRLSRVEGTRRHIANT